MGNIVKSLCEEKNLSFKIPKEKEESFQKKNKQQSPPQKSEKLIKISDFQIKRKLGEGSFGKVILVEKKKTGGLYALKKVKKERLFKNDIRLRDILNEKAIMLKASHPFIVKLYFSFQDNNYLYYGMEYVRGGVLINYLKKYKNLSENIVKFYAAQVVLALKYLHEEINVIYRDLKPENVLIDEKGYIKLADFGLSTSKLKSRN